MSSRRSKDPDQQAVYHAEQVTFEDTLFEAPLHSDDFMRLATDLFAHDWWERNGIPVPIIAPTTGRDTTSSAWVHCGTNMDPVIKIAPVQINAWTLAHEAAHVAQYHLYTPGGYAYDNIESHGREFRATYLSVAEILLGREAADALRDNFTQFVGVRPGVLRSILITPLPRREHGPADMGLFPAWRLAQQQADFARLQQRIPAPSVQRINGAIAL